MVDYNLMHKHLSHPSKDIMSHTVHGTNLMVSLRVLQFVGTDSEWPVIISKHHQRLDVPPDNMYGAPMMA